MKTKSKKLIIILISIVVVMLVGIIAVFVFSSLSSTTIKDLRLIDLDSEVEIKDKRVYLTATDENFFDVALKTNQNSYTQYIVYSNNNSVAQVSTIDKGYRVYYKKAGTVRITATTLEQSNISDSFILNVEEFVPTELKITDDKAIGESEIEIYADNLEYRFDFEALQGNVKENINLSSISVLESYDKSVFKSIYVDAVNSQLVVSAYQSEAARREMFTLQSKQLDNEGNVKTVQTFVIYVNIKGNYIADIQLMLSVTPNFTTSKYIYGDGLLNEGEERVEAVYLTDAIHTVYAKVRVVYTNGEMFDVTKDVTSASDLGSISRPQLSDYFAIDILGQTATIKFSHVGKEEGVELSFIHLINGESGYNDFVNNKLYSKTTDYDGCDYYEYIYWDTRFSRNDAITDKDGKIVGFVREPPTCLG